jgi:hypothetical protein
MLIISHFNKYIQLLHFDFVLISIHRVPFEAKHFELNHNYDEDAKRQTPVHVHYFLLAIVHFHHSNERFLKLILNI